MTIEEKPAQDTTKAEDTQKPEEKVKEQPKETVAKEEPKKEEPQKEAPKVPEKYNLVLPKDSKLDSKSVEEIASYAKEQGFSQEQAQRELERESRRVDSNAENQQKQLEEAAKKWAESAEADSVIGGQEFSKNVEIAKRAIDAFGDQELKDILNNSKTGNHPAVLRFCYKIGKAMSEDKLVLPGAAPVEKKPLHEVLYPSQAEK